jgi:hypothetical protein
MKRFKRNMAALVVTGALAAGALSPTASGSGLTVKLRCTNIRRAWWRS